jgi:hypothetical protein
MLGRKPPSRTDARPYPAPYPLPVATVRYAAALRLPELCHGRLAGWLTTEATAELAFLRRCDLGEAATGFAELHTLDEALLDPWCRAHAEDGSRDTADRLWAYLALVHALSSPEGERVALAAALARTADEAARVVAEGRAEFLVARARSGEGMDWSSSTALMGTDRPEEVDAAFDRGESLAGLAVIGLALTCPDADAILPRAARAMAHPDPEVSRQGTLALAHTARLHGRTDPRCLELLRARRRGNEADDDVWAYVPHRRLPWWLWRHHLGRVLRWNLWERWRS